MTLLNIHKPRDRSHYERFRHYHETFYRSVEVGSVTPFSARALDRGFAGALVALARHARPELTPPRGVEQIAAVRVRAGAAARDAFLERVDQQPLDADERARGAAAERQSPGRRPARLLARRSSRTTTPPASTCSTRSTSSKGPKPLLREMLDTDFESEHHRKFRVNRSLRDVEPEVNLFLKDLDGAVRGGRRVSGKAHGQVRRSQVITTCGPGALIDLPRHSAIVGGLETWPNAGDLEEIVDPRLTQKLALMTGVAAPRLYAPPPDDDRSRREGRRASASGASRSGSSSRRRPRRASSERSRRLVHRKALDEKRTLRRPRGRRDPLRARLPAGPRRRPRLAPVRPPGEDDGCRRQLWLDERGTSGDLADLTVRCECGKSRGLHEAAEFESFALGTCRGYAPMARQGRAGRTARCRAGC